MMICAFVRAYSAEPFESCLPWPFQEPRWDTRGLREQSRQIGIEVSLQERQYRPWNVLL